MQGMYLSQQGLVALQQAVSLAAEGMALSLVVPMLQASHSCKAALQMFALLTHPTE